MKKVKLKQNMDLQIYTLIYINILAEVPAHGILKIIIF